MVKEIKKILFILAVVYIINFFIIDIGISSENRNPFKDWFPIIKEETVEQETVIIEEEKMFDVSSYALQGVVWGSYKPKAVINSKIYSIGDILDGAEIIKIDKEGVALKLDDKEYLIATKNVNIEKKADNAADIENNENKESKTDEEVKTGGNE